MTKEEAFKAIQEIVYADSGMRIDDSKGYLVDARLNAICRQEGVSDIAELMAKLGPRPAQSYRKAIVESLTTNETWWFRDPDLFHALREEVFPELVRQKLMNNQREIVLWSAAASTGQEAYSIKIEFEKFRPKARGVDLKILCTDIDSSVIERGKEGRYSQLEVGRGLPTMDLMMNFEQEGNSWLLNDNLKGNIEWMQHSLMDRPNFAQPVDIALCRNVLIYFDDDGKRQILSNISSALGPNGLLFVGGSESIFTLETGLERIRTGKVFAYGYEKAQAMMSAAS